MDAKKIGKRIQSIRMERNLTQAELAQILNLTPKYLSNVECGAKCLSMDTFVDLANALESDANSLLVDVLNVSTPIHSSNLTERLSQLPPPKQRRLLRIFELMSDDAIKSDLLPKTLPVAGSVFAYRPNSADFDTISVV